MLSSASDVRKVILAIVRQVVVFIKKASTSIRRLS
ncbi:unnamed protein product [Larinioides sclopetarius]|uniref:Uncharacterized protein n=1 Tax=Larinioides sclopetarius TaxID=280406 RepID=A0AAV2BJT1_9ARAC